MEELLALAAVHSGAGLNHCTPPDNLTALLPSS